MKTDTDKEARIIIHIYNQKEPIYLSGTTTYNVEDLCIYTAKVCNIGLVARHIFGLWCSELKAWLSPSTLIDSGGVRKWVLQFKVRFKLPHITRLHELKDPIAFDYCFHQTRSDFMVGNIPEITHHKDEALGLAATDMIRVMIEENLSLDDMKSRYRDFLPQEIWKKHRSYLQKPLLDAADKGLVNSKKNILYVKEQFINQVWELAPEYGSEEYIAQIDDNGKVWEVLLQINPYHKEQAGLRMQLPRNKKAKWTHICSIEDLYYISMRNDNTVEVSRRNGIPQYLKFPSLDQMHSFISCLDGYYRLTEKWTFNLCRELSTPSLLKLKTLKCHGPVGYKFSCQKLKEKRNFEPGSYLLRESSSCYDEIRVDICCNTEENPLFLSIRLLDDDCFALSGEKETFTSIVQLVNHACKQLGLSHTPFCVTPSEYDKTQLVLCRPQSCDNKNLLTQRDCSCTSQCIPSNAVVFSKGEEIKGRFCSISPALLRRSGGEMRPITVKELLPEFISTHIQDFLRQSSQTLLWQCEAIVATLGVILYKPLALVLESLPLGPLDQYLRLHSNQLQHVDLIEAASYLARALWFLDEQQCSHGKIRCRNIMVANHTDNSFKIKLGDPGLPIYDNEDLPWIPPECYFDFSLCQYSTSADVFAFGTTLWEIFSYGEPPAAHQYQNIGHISEPQPLTSPPDCHEDILKLMQECWSHDPDSRKHPQAIMRDINQTLYEVYNSRRSHSYASVYPTQASPKLPNLASPSPPPISPRGIRPHSQEPLTPSQLTHKSSFIKNTIRLVKNSNISFSYDQFSNYSSASDRSTFTMLTDADSMCDMPQTSIGSLFSLDSRTSDSQQDNNTTLLDSGDSSPWVIDYNQLTMGQTLGQGFYGEVRKASLSQWEGLSEEIVAVKSIKKSDLSESGFRDLLREIDIMKSLRHENIVEIKGLVEEPQTMLVMEYLELGSLLAHLQMYKNKLTVSGLLKFASDIAEGMQYLEEKKIVHRDLASRNILVASPTHVKISDFGLAQFTENHYYRVRTERNLPIRWYSPESIKFGKFSHKSDVWSYGVTMWEMFSYGENPIIPNVPDTSLVEALEKGIRLTCPDQCPREVYRLMGDCWQKDSLLRPSFSKIHQQTEELRERLS